MGFAGAALIPQANAVHAAAMIKLLQDFIFGADLILVGRGATSLLVSPEPPLLNGYQEYNRGYQLINSIQGGTVDALASAIRCREGGLESDHSAATVSAAVGRVHGGLTRVSILFGMLNRLKMHRETVDAVRCLGGRRSHVVVC